MIRTEEEHREHCTNHGFPWCDTCKLPVVWNDSRWLHSTAEHPFGVPRRIDSSGHKVTCKEWWADF